MKGNEMKIFVFIASVIIGLLISLNISFGDSDAAVMVNSQQYMKLMDTKLQLQKDLMNIKEESKKNNDKLLRYQTSVSSEVKQEMEQELNTTRLLLGTTEVTGPGIRISIKDHSYEYDATNEDPDNPQLYIIHNSDLFTLVKTLRSKGAKAITINGIRVTGSSSIMCSGNFIDVDGMKLPAPYEICAIGNKDQLYSYMQKEDGIVQILRNLREINVFIEPVDKLVMPAYIPQPHDSYLKTTTAK